jgi:hypothetical protein
VSTTTDIPDADYVYEGLLRRNYFPMTKKHLEEVPPIFTTLSLAKEDADELVSQIAVRREGYDQIEYRILRFNGVARALHIPHPLPYAALCKCIFDNWARLQFVCTNQESQIRPDKHEDDRLMVLGLYQEPVGGRIVLRDGPQTRNAPSAELSLAMDARFRATADVSNCYPSLYTHAIPWALVGHCAAKQNRQGNLWHNALDKCARQCKRGETQGLPIGPGTSAILSEVILGKVDDALRTKGHRFVRYIDDYRCYCPSREKAEEFVRDLEYELAKYLLALNAKKVLIEDLPQPQRPEWLIDVVNHLPEGESASPRRVTDTLDYALALQKRFPEANVVKYAARALLGHLDTESAPAYVQYLMMMARHYPMVFPLICEAAAKHGVVVDAVACQETVRRHLLYRRSDAVCWGLFLLSKQGHMVDPSLADDVIASRDCMGIAALLATGQHDAKVDAFVDGLAGELTDYDRDQHWLLIHERGHAFKSLDAYRQQTGLKLLYDRGVRFLDLTAISPAPAQGNP